MNIKKHKRTKSNIHLGGNMLQIERRQMIIQYLEEHEAVTVEELAKLFNVAPMTIRRDLQFLEDKNIAARTFGGAVLKSRLIDEVPYENKSLANIEKKKKIADYAASLIRNGDTVILDAGTTNMEIARLLVNYKNLKIITTDLNIATFVSASTDFEILFPGGKVQNSTGSCYGSSTVDFLKNINADISFIGSSSVDIQHGITTPSMEKADVKRQMIKCSDKSILVADSSKFGKKSLIKVCNLNDFHGIITDSNLDELTADKIKSKKIKIKLV